MRTAQEPQNWKKMLMTAIDLMMSCIDLLILFGLLTPNFCCHAARSVTKFFLWSVSDVDANESSANDLPPVNLIPSQVIYSHHTGREATCCTWLPNVNEQRTFLSGGSDGELFVCNFNGTILAALSKSFEDEKNTDGEVGKAREETDDRSASLLPPYENRWPGNE